MNDYYYYYWYGDAPEGKYSILRVYTEGQVHLDDHLEMLNALNDAYTTWCKMYVWTESARRDEPFEVGFTSEHPRFRYLERWLSRRFGSRLDQNYEELASLILAARWRETATSLTEAISLQVIDPRNRPILHRCELASPGSIDIAGIGAVLAVIKDWIANRGLRKAQERETNARARLTEAEATARELDNLEHEVRLARDFRSIALDLGFSPTEVRGILTGQMPLALKPLNSIIDRGQIHGAEMMPMEQTGTED